MNRRPLILSVVVVAALSLLAAGCGGGGNRSGIASVADTTTAATTSSPPSQNGLLAFSQCMRSNGVSSFPDPQHFVGGNVKLTIHQDGSAGGAHFQAALDTCNHLLPSGPQGPTQQTRTQLADELSFARCMRSHGVSRFPDPTSQDGITVEMVQAQGIDVHSPQVLRVVQTCIPAAHGALTVAKVRAAIDHAGH